MSRGGRHLGPKKGTRRKKKEYMRSRKLLMEDARANQKEDKRWEMPDSPTWINFAFHGKAGRDILSSQRTYRQYIVCYNDNLHFHVFSDHCTIHLCLGVFAIGLFSSRWRGINYLTTKLVLLSTLIEELDSRTFLIEGVSYDLPSWYNCL